MKCFPFLHKLTKRARLHRLLWLLVETEDCLRGETPDGEACKCSQDTANCFICSVSIAGGDDLGCIRCRNGLYLNVDTFTCVTADVRGL